MRLKHLFVVALAAVLLAVSAVFAQDADWQIVAISGVSDQRELLTITADGITDRVALPPDFPVYFEQMALSPDGNLLATIPAGWNRLVLADIGADDCCTEFAFTDADVSVATLAGFSPDGTQLALSYVVESPAQSAMLLMDVATGEIDVFIDMTTGSASDPRFVTYPILTDWNAQGIPFVTSCINCVDAAMDNAMSLWEPVSGAVSRIAARYDYRNDHLELTPSTLEAVFALDYPSAADAEAIFWGAQEYGVRNAVVLTGEQAENGEAVVYATDQHTSIISRWVADGSAFLVFFTNDTVGGGELVLASGETQPVDFAFGHFLTGTPDGWVTQQDGQLTHHRLQNSTVMTTELGEYSGPLTLVQGPPLGASGSLFATVTPPEPVICDGFIESRLVAGHLGRVLPGAANNMRAEASTISLIIAKIAGAEPFAILEGPVCNQGLAWWRVSFNHQEGWTAEGSGRNYWLEQAPANGYRAPAQDE